jgi:phosphocarrier protein FPr/phosphocarrier protein
MSTTILRAPLGGWAASLDEVPDEVFAHRMLGDGIAIDPTTSELLAPCDGEVISVAATRHAVAVRAASGAEILMHVGIDTVALQGEGFEAHVRPGDRVRTGQRLLSFDLDLLARRTRSLLTPMVITNGEQHAVVVSSGDREVSSGEIVMELRAAGSSVEAAADEVAGEVIEKVIVQHEHGIHARPGALIARYAKASTVELDIRAHGRSASARSAVALMSLGVQRGDELLITGAGPGAAAAVAGLRRLIEGMADAPGLEVAPQAVEPVLAPRRNTAGEGRLQGVIASRGFALGRAFHLRPAELVVSEAGQGVGYESAELDRARGEVQIRLQRLASAALPTAREVIAAHLEFLDDRELVGSARRAIAEGKSAAYGWRRAIRESATAIEALGDAHLAERVNDLLDIEQQVLTALLGETSAGRIDLPEGAIVLAEDLKPSQLVTLDGSKLAGICLAAGGPTSHVAILAAAMGIPALVASGRDVLRIPEGTPLILDGERGELRIAPEPQELAAAEARQRAGRVRAAAERAAAQDDCHTADGQRIEVYANLGSLADAGAAVAQGAEGCGLLRTEFLFLERAAAPDEHEQLARYQEIAAALGGRPLIVRTLDVGGDKPIAYLRLPEEANPALGLRGVRIGWREPGLLRLQLRALLQVRPAGQCRVLLPMITDVHEIRALRRMLEEEAGKLGVSTRIPLGAMIETPAAAVLADQLAGDTDFLSIGTNDLAQYVLAMDRGHADLAPRIDGLHPAVLRLVRTATDAALARGRPVAVCGGLAADPAAIPILLGLGVTELSVVPTAIPRTKRLIRPLRLEHCRALAHTALEQDSAAAVRELVARSLPCDIEVQ